MPSWFEADRVLVIVLDQSGSMTDVIDGIRHGCLSLENSVGCKTAVQYIVFDDVARSGESLQTLPFRGGGTQIYKAFQELHCLIRRHGAPRKLDLVFISDGEDSNMRECEERLAALKPPPCPSRLFSVGVRSGFPTTLVTDHLYPKFGRESDVSAPPVLPLESPDEISLVFEQLCSYVNDVSPPPPPQLEDFTEETSVEALYAGAKQAYNACMHGCFFHKSSSELASLTQCEAILVRICRLCVLAISSVKRRVRGSGLPSHLVTPAGGLTPAEALELAQKLRAQVRQCLDRAHRNLLLTMLDNDAKRQIAGFAGRCGTHALKALRWRSVDFDRSKGGLLSALKDYKGSPLDAALEDQIGGYTQEEVLLDAGAVLPAIEASVNSIIDLLRKLPLVGRTLTIRPICDGADMNPWLQEVVGLPSTIRFMTTYDLLHTPQRVLNSRAIALAGEPSGAYPEDDEEEDGRAWELVDPKRAAGREIPPETINHLLLLPGSLGHCGWMHLASTYLLLRNETLFHHEAWMGTMAATDVGATWVRAELDRVREAFGQVYTNQNAPGFFQYVDHLQSPFFRECLVSASDALPPACRCPHLTKYVFALWLTGHWNATQLRKRQLALLVELFHRAGQGLAWRCARAVEPAEWLASRAPPRGDLLRHATLSEAQRERRAELAQALAGLAPETVLAEVALDTEAVGRAAHFQFSLASVAAMFRGLASLSSVEAYFSAELAPQRLAAVLLVAAQADNLRRAADPQYTRQMPAAEYARRGSRKALCDFAGAVLAAEDAALEGAFASASRAAHGGGPATAFAPGHVAEFRARYGVDLASLYGLSDAGLPTNACCLPGCPLYLRPLGPVAADAGGRLRPRLRGGGRLHPRLRAHLAPVAVVPGLHKTIQSLRKATALERVDGGDLLACVRVVAEMVRTGSCLDWQSHGAIRLEQHIHDLESRGEEGGARWPARRDNIAQSLRRRIQELDVKNLARLQGAIADSLDRHSGGDPAWLENHVSGLLCGYAAGADSRAYRRLEAAVLLGTRCGATGRLLGVRP